MGHTSYQEYIMAIIYYMNRLIDMTTTVCLRILVRFIQHTYGSLRSILLSILPYHSWHWLSLTSLLVFVLSFYIIGMTIIILLRKEG